MPAATARASPKLGGPAARGAPPPRRLGRLGGLARPVKWALSAGRPVGPSRALSPGPSPIGVAVRTALPRPCSPDLSDDLTRARGNMYGRAVVAAVRTAAASDTSNEGER